MNKPDQDRYGINIRVALIVSLLAIIGVFLFVRQPQVKPYIMRTDVTPVTLEPLDNVLNMPVAPPGL